MQQWSLVESSGDTLLRGDVQAPPAQRAAALARAPTPGHFDELRGAVSPLAGALPTPAWSQFFEHLEPPGFADLDRRNRNLARQVRDNGITYNVHVDANDPPRPWSLDLFPLLLTPEGWQAIEAGVLQRMRLLEGIMADVYGPQRLLAANLLPPALVHGHPGYLRTLHGATPAGGRHLHIAAFDLARDAQGHWWIVSQRTQAPSGLGYLLENRLIVSRLFPQAFSALHVQRVANGYSALLDSLRAMSPAGGDEPRIVLLTPGPHSQTYFEHAFLARYLGLPLVEGGDLTVRAERLYLKTLDGLAPVHGVLKRLDDDFLDPLELRGDSRLGVPGLLQAIRAGNVLVANTPGSGFLESPALHGFLPAIAQHLLGQELALPSLPTWWCGERAAMEAALPQLAAHVIKPTYPGPGGGAVAGRSLSPAQLHEWAERIVQAPDDHTLQSFLPFSQMPTWEAGRITPRSLLLRVFTIPDAQGGWRVLPGGLTRLTDAGEASASMQRGGSSADTWVLGPGHAGAAAANGPPAGGAPPAVVAPRGRIVTSRAGENLFWLGRYTERAENTARLARLALVTLSGEDQSLPPLLEWIGRMAAAHALVPPGLSPTAGARQLFERSLIDGLADARQASSVGFTLGAIRQAASAVRERLSLEQWNLIVHAEQDFLAGCARGAHGAQQSPLEAVRVLEQLSVSLAAMTGTQADRMTRDNGWRLLSVGRHLERLGFLASALSQAFESGAVRHEAGFDALLALFDSTLTYQATYPKRHDLPALLDLLVLHTDNPRSLGGVAQILRARLARIDPAAAAMGASLPDPQGSTLEALCEADDHGHHPRLQALLQQCRDAANRLSDDLTARYFTHAEDARHSVGA